METLLIFLPLAVIVICGGIKSLYEMMTLTTEERAKKEADLRKKQQSDYLAEAAKKEETRIRAGESQGWDIDKLDGEYQFMSKIDKEEYMSSQKWNNIKKLVIERDKVCFTCKSQDGLNVHHINYLRLGRENLNDLIVLCKNCHFSLHNEKGYSRQGLYKPKGFKGLTPNYEDLRQSTDFDLDFIWGGMNKKERDKYGYESTVLVSNPEWEGYIRLGSMKTGCYEIKRHELESTTEIDLSEVIDAEDGLNLKAIHKLKNLKYLYLRDCLLQEIPEQIGELIYLEELDLRGNDLTSLPDFLGNLTSLRSLKIPKNEFYYISPLLDGLPFLDEESKNSIKKARIQAFYL